MTSSDLLLLITTLAVILITGFICFVLYWLIRLLRIWTALSAEIERNMHQCVDRFHQTMHALTSLKTIADIGMQTFQTAMATYQKKSRKKKSGEDE